MLRNARQRPHDIVEQIGVRVAATWLVSPEEGSCEVIEGAAIVRQLPYSRIHVVPYEGALGVVVFAALPAWPKEPPHIGGRRS